MLLQSLLAATFFTSVLAQDYSAAHNTTPIVGTWSSGTQRVVPGPGFANPAQETFTYPNTSGVGFSFSDDGWYELARFRYVANGSHPECIVGTIVWAHGNYDLLDNGSIVLTPIGDGYQQVQSPCNKDNSNFLQNYNITELFVSWRIFTDVTFGPKLHLFQWDGSAVAPLFRLSEEPNMLPNVMRGRLLHREGGSSGSGSWTFSVLFGTLGLPYLHTHDNGILLANWTKML
ncbi:chaperone for protein-folding within the ER, fungal-domain-containing protein [Mycena amicta]|nr:chaperone for protein-folding within the ER, fungal-domain-containing protein [Mycena amicta]